MSTKLPEMKTIAINLIPFYLKRVAVTLRNGDVFTGVIKDNTMGHIYPFMLFDRSKHSAFCWTIRGQFRSFSIHEYDIVEISELNYLIDDLSGLMD